MNGSARGDAVILAQMVVADSSHAFDHAFPEGGSLGK
jgi:hypothetical protein